MVSRAQALYLFMALTTASAAHASSAPQLSLEGSGLWTNPASAQVRASMAYCAYTFGIAVYDLSDSSDIQEAGRLALFLGTPVASALDSDFMYVLTYGTCGSAALLHVIDIADPETPTWRSTTEIAGIFLPMDMDVSDGFAFVATNGMGLRVVDVGDPDNPVEVGFYGSGSIRDVIASDSLVYAIEQDSSTRVIILSAATPASPTLVGVYDTTASLGALDVSGNHIFVVADDHSMLVVDALVPSLPVQVGQLTASSFNNVFVDDSVAVLFGSDSLFLVDVSPPNLPQQLAATFEESSDDVGRKDAVVVCAGLRGLAFHVLTPSSQQLLQRTGNGSYEDVSVHPPYAYVADGQRGLEVVHIAQPAAPVSVGILSPQAYEHAEAVVVSGAYAYLAEGDSGVAVVDVSNPANPTGIHRVPASYAKNLAVSDNYVYVADQEFGLRIVDITVPSAAYERSSVDSVGQPFGVAVEGNYAYVAGDTALFSVNVSNPDSPYTVSRYEGTDENLREVLVSGGRAYLAYEASIEILDVTSPAVPVPLGSYLPSGVFPQSLSKDGDYLYVGNGDQVLVLDVADPQNVFAVDSVCTPYFVGGLQASNGYVWVPESPGFLVFSNGEGSSCPVSVTGDVNVSGAITSSDIILLVNYVFKSGATPQPCAAAGDANCNGAVSSSDIIALVNFVFKGGAPPCDVCLLVPSIWSCP